MLRLGGESMAEPKKGFNVKYLEQQAQDVREKLSGKNQNALFEAAVEVGFLTALANGTEDPGEREALVKAIEILSAGLVIEWEVEPLVDAVSERIDAQGSDARCAEAGKKIKELGQPEAGLLIGAIVAHATAGIDKQEASVLEKIGTAAGMARQEIAAIVKKARG
jgi:tellurite resistance protein